MQTKISNIALTVVLMLCSLQGLRAQRDDLYFERISLERGLSQNTVYCILQDRKGFLWIGTQDGLNKYDGYDFKIYKHDPRNPNSLSSSVVTAVYEDHSGVLWIGTNNGGLNKFNRDRETFTHYRHDPNNPESLSDDNVLAIFQDRSGDVWIGTRGGGLNKLVPATGAEAALNGARPEARFIHFKNEPDNAGSLSHNYVQAIGENYLDGESTLWVGTHGGGLNQLVQDKNEGNPSSFIHYKHDPNDPASLSDDFVRFLYCDSSGALWIGTRNGLNRMMPGTGNGARAAFARYQNVYGDSRSSSFNAVWSIAASGRGSLWIGTANGLDKLVLNEHEGGAPAFFHFGNDPNNPNSLSDNYIRTVYTDRSGITWIGTWNGGLNKLDRKRETFAHFKHNPDNPQSLNHNNVRAIWEDRERMLWVGTRGGGLNKLNRKREVVARYTFPSNNPAHRSNNHIWSVFEDRAGTLWIGTYGGGLIEFDRASERFIQYRHDPTDSSSLSHYYVTPIYEDRGGNLWIGTDGGGLNTFDRDKKIFKHYKNEPDKANSLSHNKVWSILEDRDGVLWIGTAGGGLNRFDRKEGSFVHYKNAPDDSTSLSDDHVFAIHEDSRAALWLGTWGGGLNRLDRKTGKFTRFGEKHGLPNEVIYGILEDDYGNLWLSTNKGLSRFDLETQTFKNYNMLEGLQSNEFNAGAYHKSRTGELFFGGINGFNAFYPDRVRDNQYLPPVVITAFKRFDEIIAHDIASDSAFELPYKDKYLTFEFVALDYTHPEKNQYAFMMEGFDENWIQAGGRRFASYTNLDPGEYTFKVKGSNNDGVWNERGISIRLTITPPWWKTWWAYACYLLAFGALLLGARRYELNRMQLKNRLRLEHMEATKLKELDLLKSRFFANISHEFRTPLTLILGPLENVAARVADSSLKQQLHTAFNNGRRLLRLINQLLDLSKLEAGSMELRACPGDLLAFLKGIVFTFESAARHKQIALEFHTDYDRLEAYYDVEKLEQVFYNLMSNAIKFVPPNENGKISVKVVKAQASFLQKLPPNVECVRITVRDTGIGIPASELPHVFDRFYQVEKSRTHNREGTGIGLALAKEMVELHYGQIEVSSSEQRGSTFVVTLPLGKEHLQPEEIFEETNGNSVPRKAHTAGAHAAALPSFQPSRNPLIPNQASNGADPAAGKELILVVEDNHEVRAFVRQQLEPDYEIIEAVDGHEGMEKASTAIPDLIVSDVMMPKMNGYDFCAAVKTEEKTSHVPVILLTARAGQENKLEGLATGADDYLTKPFSSKELQARVRNLLEQRRKLRARFSREVILKPKEIALTPPDERFLIRIKEIVEENLGDEEFSVEDLGRQAGMSRAQLHRKLKALTDQSAGEFILSMRLQRAIELLKQNAGTVAEIAYMTGFNTPNYFAKCFRKQFGCSPSEYKMKLAQEAS